MNLNTKASIKLDKDQSSLLTRVAIATAIAIFCLVGIKNLISQGAYQRRVIHAREVSIQQIKTNISNANNLTEQYNQVFEGNSPENIIGGVNTKDPNAQPPNGDNGTIVLHALPTTYDFPALLTSISKLMGNTGISSQAVTGSDQSSNIKNDPVAKPQPTKIDLTVSGTSTYDNARRLIKDFERSIRPFDITTLSLGGNQSALTMTFNTSTYYQQAKSTALNSKEVK